MSVPLLHYRPWNGELRGPAASVWPIARVALRVIFRRKLFWGIYGLGLMIFLLFFFGQYLLTWAEDQGDETNVSVMGFKQSPRTLVHVLREFLKLDGEPHTFRNFFWYQGYIVMVVLALAGAVLIGNDIHHGSMPFYLSKPISRWHYLAGKCLAVSVFINLLTTLPDLILYAQFGMLKSMDYFVDQHRTALGILGYGALLTVCLSLLIVATASLVRRTVPLIMIWTGLFFFCPLLSQALVDGLHYNRYWRLIDLWNDAYLVGNAMLGIDPTKLSPAEQPSWYAALLVLGSVCLICTTYLIPRTRAVEIVR
jgi:ABC-type transport system involved in multi-copper enzyme maturation permease subunit